ncbi:Propionate transporter [Cedecea neteri]|uniref:Propionate transporter n=1 Tax=Cedecea neteri TaxID=158822 RepID=A0A2X3J4Y8_9ENTR|nr:Propionate transporter [Cedecea neteri]
MTISTPMLVTFLVYIFGMILIGFYRLAVHPQL